MGKHDEYRAVCREVRQAEQELTTHRIAVDHLRTSLHELNDRQRALAIEVLMEISETPVSLPFELEGPGNGLAALTGGSDYQRSAFEGIE